MRRRKTPDQRSGHEFQGAPVDSSNSLTHSQMGDLPDDIQHEREQLRQPSAGELARNPRFPPDVSYQQSRADEAAAGEVGTVTQGANVRSTYDARPINARDFMETNLFTVPAGV